MMRFQILLAALFLFSFPSLSLAHEHHSALAEQTAKPSGDSLYNLQAKWQTQDGKEIQLQSLQGHPVVLTMAYTSCQTSCPLIVDEMKQIEAHLKKKDAVMFVMASFDVKRDTPDQLKKFAEERKLDPTHWVLLHGSPGAVQELAAALGVKYKENAQGDFDHSNVISVLDEKGVIRHQQAGINKGQKEIEEKVSELAKSK